MPIVEDIQRRLNELGYMEEPEVDGKKGFTTSFGPATKAAVRAFQAVNGLDVDGRLGQITFDLLISDKALPLMFNNSCDDGVFQAYTEKLQTRLIELGFLEGKVSGKFTDRTTVALKAFQEKNGLDPDGTAGPKTLAVLYSDEAVNKNGTAVPMTRATPAPAGQSPKPVTSGQEQTA